MKIAFIGLGSMGAPLARLIARAGHELGVYDSHAPAGEAFRDIAAVAGSPADAARGAEVVCVCVRDDRQVEDVVSGRNGLAGTLAPGALLLVHSTIRIDTVQRIGAALAAQGVALVDAPVSRTRRSDDAPFVFTMLGGESRDVERARAVVESFSTDVEHMGPSGAGMATKIANNPWPSRNPTSTPPSGPPAMSCAAAWMPASTRTTSCSCCSSSTSATSTATATTSPRRSHPEGRELRDMVALKGNPDIGDKINTQIIQPLIDANAASPAATSPTSTIRTSSARARRWSSG
jgi:hypothetical protein